MYVHKEQKKAQETRTRRTQEKEEGCKSKECIRGTRRDNRIKTTAMPDHSVTLCLIILRDVRSSMKLVQRV